MTERLYYHNAHMAEFDAKVLSCEEANGRYAVLLDRTAFYPEGGGQACDTGSLGASAVLDVQMQNDEVVHFCDQPLEVGDIVHGAIDWEQRFDRMQQHSGEHIVSGIVHRKFHYDNVGFHMGSDCMTIDFSGYISDDDLREIEREANAIVADNREILITLHASDSLQGKEYRSKKELTGIVRLVNIPGADLCTCCGTHVSRTGEIGVILFLGRERLRGGTRLELLCGRQAMEYIFQLNDQSRRISAFLSAKPTELADAVKRMGTEVEHLKQENAQFFKNLSNARAEQYRNASNVFLLEDSLDSNQIGKLACAVAEQCGGVCAAFTPRENGFFFAVSQTNGDVRPFCKAMLTALGGRGGGKPELNQGTVPCSRRSLEAYFKEAFSQ